MCEIKNLEQALSSMKSRGRTKKENGLKNIKMLMDKLDNPQDKIKTIHVAGTNGKGSTSNFIASTVGISHKCGIFTSPYMYSVTDSIKINGQNIPDEKFIEYLKKMIPIVEEMDAIDHHLAYFDLLVAIMYSYFNDEKVDVAVIEVGLGGTRDSTNVIKSPLASVITTISLDHIWSLGFTLEEIAENKAGIIKPNSPVFVYPQQESVMAVFEKIAFENNAPLQSFEKEEIQNVELSDKSNKFDFRNYKKISTKLIGIHQLYNASLAIMVLDYLKDEFNLTDEDIYNGFFNAENVGRLQIVSQNPRIMLDGSHNQESINALKNSLEAIEYDKLIIGFTILFDKDYDYVIKELSNLADELIVTTVQIPDRSFSISDLEEEAKKYRKDVIAIEDKFEAFEYSKKIASDKDLILWCGSLYLIRELLLYLKNK